MEILLDVVSENKKSIITGVLENCLLELGVLEDAYITSRCVMREFTKQEVEKLKKAVKEVMENSHKFLVKTALKRQEAFRNLWNI